MTQAHAEAAQGGGIMRDGKLSYVQIPASDVRASARFYERVFGWRIRDDGNASHLSFEDASGELIGAFVTTIAPGETGVLPYIYVRDIEARVRGIEDAVRTALATSAQKVHGQSWCQITDLRASIDDSGNVEMWQVEVKVGFKVDG